MRVVAENSFQPNERAGASEESKLRERAQPRAQREIGEADDGGPEKHRKQQTLRFLEEDNVKFARSGEKEIARDDEEERHDADSDPIDHDHIEPTEERFKRERSQRCLEIGPLNHMLEKHQHDAKPAQGSDTMRYLLIHQEFQIKQYFGTF